MQHKFIFGILAICLLGSCVSNESSVLISAMKAPPSPPDCSVSVSDGTTWELGVDLSFGNDIVAFFLVENKLMVREDYAKPSAETNGVFIEGAEVLVRALNGAPLGSREYYEFETYIPPESEGIAQGMVLSQSTINIISQQLGCPSAGNLPIPPPATDYGKVYADVKFVGHTSGGTDVETPSFTVTIGLCCGCLIDWIPCMDPCTRYCEDADDSKMCIPGLRNGVDPFDCRQLFYAATEWVDPATSETRTCDDCGS